MTKDSILLGVAAAAVAATGLPAWADAAPPAGEARFAIRRQIDPALLDNRQAFDTPFFQQFQLRHAPEPLDLGEGIHKNYLFPTLYTHVVQSTALFSADYAAVAKKLPTDRLKPVSVGLGRTVVAFSSYEYRTVLGIPGYREVAIAVPVVPSQAFAPPLLPLLKSNWKGLGFYILSMPVTSLENRKRGRQIWGLAKDLERIDLEEEGPNMVTRVYDQGGQQYLRFSVATQGDAQTFQSTTDLYSVLDGEILTSRAQGVGDMQVTQQRTAMWGFGSGARLEIGTGPKADFLRELGIHPVPFETRYAPQVSSMFDLPHHRQKQ